MTSMLVDCHRDAPARPPDWRWRLAEAIHSGQLPTSRGRFDQWVKRAIQFQRDQAAGEGDASIDQSGRLDPAILRAFEIRFSAEPRLRSILEARVLTGQTAATIAAVWGHAAEVVEAFERHYFDIRDRLKAADFIWAFVIGIPPMMASQRQTLF